MPHLVARSVEVKGKLVGLQTPPGNVPANTTEMMTSVRPSEDISDAEVLREMIPFAERLLPESRESFASIAPIANYLRDEAATFEGGAIGFPSSLSRWSVKDLQRRKVVQAAMYTALKNFAGKRVEVLG